MTVHQLFPAVRPALAPVLFPTSMDELLAQRAEAAQFAIAAWLSGKPRAFVTRQDAWMDRLSARIARRAGA